MNGTRVRTLKRRQAKMKFVEVMSLPTFFYTNILDELDVNKRWKADTVIPMTF